MAGGFAGPNPIGWQDIDAFVNRTGLRLAAWEIGLIEALDDLYLTANNTRRPPPSEKTEGIIASAPMTDGSAVHALIGTLGVRKTVTRKRGQ